MGALTHLECSGCRKAFDPRRLWAVCDACTQPLLARYDLAAVARAVRPSDLAGRPATMWRYIEVLPVEEGAAKVSLGETITPLLRAPRLGERLGLGDLWVKDETRLPTGTFKARGLAMSVTRAAVLGVVRGAIPSAGNAAEAFAVYAARAGIPAWVFMPRDAPLANVRVCQAAGARVYLVDGLIGDAGRIVRAGAEAGLWFDFSTFREPYRVEGKKTMGLELAEQLGWELPEVIVYPTGGGTGLVGMWKAFAELEALGFIGPARPRLVAVQPTGCAPVVRALASGAEETTFWEGARTVAHGLRVPRPFADRLILRALRESGGTAIAVSDEEILEAMSLACACEGLLASPESAATVAAARTLREQGWIGAGERVVLFNCGTMLKHLDLVRGGEPPLIDPSRPIDLEALLAGEAG